MFSLYVRSIYCVCIIMVNKFPKWLDVFLLFFAPLQMNKASTSTSATVLDYILGEKGPRQP